jgi:hypothetical protein
VIKRSIHVGIAENSDESITWSNESILCPACAEDLRLKLGKALGVSGRSRSRDRKKKIRCGGNTEIWEDLT